MRIRHMIGWCVAGFFAVLGAAMLFLLRGYSFSAYVCFAAAAVLSCYQILGMLASKNKKVAKLLRLCLSTVMGLVLLASFFTGIYVRHAAASQPEEGCAYVVVLGAGLNGTEPSMILRERLEATLEYLNENPATVCVVSGGQGAGEVITEAQCMFDWLTARGIPEERIWMETKATSTLENLEFSLALIQERTGERPDKLGIISSEFHLFRASLMAKDLGIEVVLIPAKTQSLGLRINYFLREIPAVWFYFVFGG